MRDSFEVVFSEQAIEDITDIGRWIAGEAGRETADAYVDRLEAFCLKLSHFPHRGTPRSDLLPDIRTVAFERRVVIAYRVGEQTVAVLRVISGSRDVERLLQDS